jgi:hypothetical protein
VAALEAQVNKTRASYANMNRDANAAAKEGAGMIEGRMQRAGLERPMTDTAGLMLKSAAGNAIASNREQQRLGEIQSANNIRFVAGAGQENADKLRKQQAQQKVDEVKQQAQQKAQEAAKDAVSKILGGSANSAQGEVADSLSQQQKTTEAVKGVLNLFKKKN